MKKTTHKKFKKSVDLLDKFKKIFGFNCPIIAQATPLCGYFIVDLSRLNEVLKVPKNMSIEYFVKMNYGTKALKVVKQLIEL